MKIQTFDLVIFLSGARGTGREYHNISRTAVKYYIEYWKEREDFLGYDVSGDLFKVNEEN